MPAICAMLLLPLLLLTQPPNSDPQFKVRLIAAHESVAPGGQTNLIVGIRAAAPWHFYHPIVLDTGMATRVEFDAPPGVRIGTLRYPAPTLGEAAGLEYLAFEGEIFAIAPLKVPDDARIGQKLKITARASGLACVEMCLPVSAQATLELPVTDRMGPPINKEVLTRAAGALAKPLEKAPFIEGSSIAVKPAVLAPGQSGRIVVTVNVKDGHHIQDRDPGTENLIATRLFIEQRDGLEIGEEDQQVWPKPHVRKLPGLGDVREQRGRFEIRVPIKVSDAKFASGRVTLRVLLHYQCCTDAGQCFMPEWAEGFATFEVANPAVPPTGAEPAPQPQSEVELPTEQPAGPDTEPAAAQPADRFADWPTPELSPADWEKTIPWQEWHPGWPEELARRGKIVYVDFTATWCATCQTNKAAVLDTAEIRGLMSKLGVIPIEADFSRRNPEMLAAIKKWDRPTVPLNLIYFPPEEPGGEARVVVLPVLLTRSIVRDALTSPTFGNNDNLAQSSLLMVLLAGFLGGLILNVMPCVLPVISIKVLSFVQQAGEDPGRVLRLGLAFCAGIMVWFWGFALLSMYDRLPWQYPPVVIALSALLFVFALNLFGVFELVLPGKAAGALDSLGSREGYSGAFFKGLLATLLGTACTAPFLAGALAYALTQPWWKVYMVFTAAGVGMSLPYLLLSANPAWLKYLPKPGNWMVVFKQFTGFILLGTVVWLLWILAGQLDAQGVVWTVAFLGFLGLAAWMVGQIKPTWAPTKRILMWAASFGVAGLGFYFCYYVMYDAPIWA